MIAKIVYQRVGRLCRDGMYTNKSVSICYYISVTFLPSTLLCTSLLCPLVNTLCLIPEVNGDSKLKVEQQGAK